MLADILTSDKNPAHFQPELGMPDQAKPVARPWQRFLRFTVRGLIVLVLVIGGGLGWLVRSARIQREAVAAIEKARGGVSYDWEWSNGKSIRGGKPSAPQWLVNLIGVDYFGHVTLVVLFDSNTPGDAALDRVGRLTRLEELFAGRASRQRTVRLAGDQVGFGRVPVHFSIECKLRWYWK
jgi:hypothetical protein